MLTVYDNVFVHVWISKEWFRISVLDTGGGAGASSLSSKEKYSFSGLQEQSSIL